MRTEKKTKSLNLKIVHALELNRAVTDAALNLLEVFIQENKKLKDNLTIATAASAQRGELVMQLQQEVIKLKQALDAAEHFQTNGK